jgi:hypothetical protein
MDALAVAAEVAGVLQAAESVPSIQRHRSSRKERREAYLDHQREVYRVMALANHISTLIQVDTVAWQTVALAAIPMVEPFVDLLTAKPSNNVLIKWTKELARSIVPLAKAVTPNAEAAVASTYMSQNQLKDRAVAELATLRDVAAQYLFTLGKVRLVGRPDAIAAAGVIRTLLQELFEGIPIDPNLPTYIKVLPKFRQAHDQRIREFSVRLAALADAQLQFASTISTDGIPRRHSWQIWCKPSSEISSAKELLDLARNDRPQE